MAAISGEYLTAVRIIALADFIIILAAGLGTLAGLTYAYPVFRLALMILFVLLIALGVKNWRSDQ
ncbi:MAG: hypothetical protein NTX14_01505 [Candidatus Nealsonbacteria bacterium]|jgi:hypothetical protein|nr:hypothetical protein [Candidatus Nealsonbacteria bacterium]